MHLAAKSPTGGWDVYEASGSRICVETCKKTSAEIRAEVLSEHEQIGREVATRFSRGDVNIKAGRFLTRKDLTPRDNSSNSD